MDSDSIEGPSHNVDGECISLSSVMMLWSRFDGKAALKGDIGLVMNSEAEYGSYSTAVCMADESVT